MTLVVSLPSPWPSAGRATAAVMGPIVHASHNVQVFTTVGLSIALQNLALVRWTADARFVRTDYYAVVVRIAGAAFNVALCLLPPEPHVHLAVLRTSTSDGGVRSGRYQCPARGTTMSSRPAMGP